MATSPRSAASARSRRDRTTRTTCCSSNPGGRRVRGRSRSRGSSPKAWTWPWGRPPRDQHPPRGGGGLPLAFTDDGGLLFAYARQGSTRLARFDLSARRVDDLTGPEQDVVCGSASADGSRVALTMGSVRSPGDLWVCDVRAKRLTRLYAANEALLAESNLGEVE